MGSDVVLAGNYVAKGRSTRACVTLSWLRVTIRLSLCIGTLDDDSDRSLDTLAGTRKLGMGYGGNTG